MSEVPFLPFALPEIGEEEIAEVADALRSGWVTTGPKTRQFETDFAAYIGGGVEALAVNSATAGLHLALEAVGVGPNDEVIVPSYTFTASAEVVRYLGAQPVLVDVDPVTCNISPAAIRAAITPRTRAIVPVHFAGLACDMDNTTFFLGRETLIPKKGSDMPWWREKVFVALSRNAGTVADYFGLPPNRIVELGAQIVL